MPDELPTLSSTGQSTRRCSCHVGQCAEDQRDSGTVFLLDFLPSTSCPRERYPRHYSCARNPRRCASCKGQSSQSHCRGPSQGVAQRTSEIESFREKDRLAHRTAAWNRYCFGFLQLLEINKLTLVIRFRERRWGAWEEAKHWREADEIRREEKGRLSLEQVLSFIYSSTDCVLVLGSYTVFVEFVDLCIKETGRAKGAALNTCLSSCNSASPGISCIVFCYNYS